MTEATKCKFGVHHNPTTFCLPWRQMVWPVSPSDQADLWFPKVFKIRGERQSPFSLVESRMFLVLNICWGIARKCNKLQKRRITRRVICRWRTQKNQLHHCECQSPSPKLFTGNDNSTHIPRCVQDTQLKCCMQINSGRYLRAGQFLPLL